eukprot:s1879_g21.t1
MEVTAMVAMKRQDGVLLVFPADALPEDEVAAGRTLGGGILGPSANFEVPAIIVDNGVVSTTGETVQVLAVDCLPEVLSIMREFRAQEEIVYGFDQDSPFALPDPDSLLDAVAHWIQDADPSTGLAFYTANEQEVVEDVVETPVGDQRLMRDQPNGPSGRATPRPGKAGPPGGPKLRSKPEKPKKPTTASLAAAMETVLQQIPTMVSQLAEISEKQKCMESQIMAPVSASCPALSQPLSQAVRGHALAPSVVAKHLAPPPRTMSMPSPGILRSPALAQTTELLELEQEKPLLPAGTEGNPLAQAVLTQSQALTSLVNQIAAGTSDPLLDLGGASSTGTRGSTGRAKLQNELASQKGLFFNAVMQSMARRMNPTMPVSSNAAELMEKGVCGTKYLERFGGYARHRDLGQIQYQIMQILDYLQVENMAAARDATALLAVAVEQAVMDNGRFELASVLCLQDDLPSGIFVNRNAGAFSRSRSFSPLADQRWITVALAYLKELDTIQSKRAELAGTPAKSSSPSQAAPAANPKSKANAKKKGKGRGAGNQGQQAMEEENEI